MTTPSKFRNVPKVIMDEIMTMCLVMMCADRQWRGLCPSMGGGGGGNIGIMAFMGDTRNTKWMIYEGTML